MGDRAAFIIRGDPNVLEAVFVRLHSNNCRYVNLELIGVGLLVGWDKTSAPGDVLSQLVLITEPFDVELFVVSEKGTIADDYGVVVNPEDRPRSADHVIPP